MKEFCQNPACPFGLIFLPTKDQHSDFVRYERNVVGIMNKCLIYKVFLLICVRNKENNEDTHVPI